jgi:hypothetical protein
MILLDNQPTACLLATPKHDIAGLVWCLRFRDCGLHADGFWESRLETPKEHWEILHKL